MGVFDKFGSIMILMQNLSEVRVSKNSLIGIHELQDQVEGVEGRWKKNKTDDTMLVCNKRVTK